MIGVLKSYLEGTYLHMMYVPGGLVKYFESELQPRSARHLGMFLAYRSVAHILHFNPFSTVETS